MVNHPEVPQETQAMNKKANYSANFIKNRAGEEKVKKYASDLGVKAELDFTDKSKLVSFVEEFQSAVRSKEGIPRNFNVKLLSDGYFGPHTLRAAEYALNISTGRTSRYELQDNMTRTHARTKVTDRAADGSAGRHQKPERSKEKLPKNLSLYMEHLKSLGFKAESFTHEKTGYRVCIMIPQGCNTAKVFLPGDGGSIENYLDPQKPLLKSMNKQWEEGSKAGLVFIEGKTKKSKPKKRSEYTKGRDRKYAQFDEPGNFASIIEQAEGIADAKFSKIEITGYSQGGFGIKSILTAGDYKDRITRIFVNDGVWNKDIADTLVKFATEKGATVDVAIGKSSAYSYKYFRGITSINVIDARGVGHGAILGKFMTQSMEAS